MTFPKSLFAALLAFVFLFSSCATSKTSTGALPDSNGTGARKTGMSNTAKGGLIGAGGGAAAGAILGRVIGGGKGTAIGAIVGAAAGGTAGALIGRKMDKQAEDLQRDMQNAKVERVGEGIKITFDSGILFDVNSANLRPASITEIDKMAGVLQKYPDTNVLVEGHTDASGTDAINQPLSENRAKSVANKVISDGVDPSRVTSQGYGSTQPVGDNATPEGKQANRRVEVAIYANEKMKKAAEAGKL